MAPSHLLPYLQSSLESIVIFTASSVPSESTKDSILERNKSWKHSSGNSKHACFDSIREPGELYGKFRELLTSFLFKCHGEVAISRLSVFPLLWRPKFGPLIDFILPMASTKLSSVHLWIARRSISSTNDGITISLT